MEEKVKICQACDAYYPVVDGVVNVVKNYSKNLNKKGVCKAIVPSVARKSDYVDNEEFEVIRCASMGAPEKYRYGIPGVDAEFAKRVEKEKFDVYHAHSPFSLGRFALKMARKQKVPLVATLHTQYHQDFERVLHSKALTKIMIKYIMKVYKGADSVWTVSNSSCDILRQYGYKGKIVVIRNGTDLTYPENPEQKRAEIDEKYNLKGQKNVFAFVGRMAWYKNLKLICDALKIVKDRGEDFKMLFVGGGFDLEELIEYINEIGIQDKCIMVGPVNGREELQKYYLRTDALLFPSTFDTAGVVGIEAAAHKVPTIMVKGSSSAETLTDNVDGFLCEETAESYADKICELCNAPERMKEAGEQAYKNVYRTWSDVADEVYEKYLEVIKDYKRKQEARRRVKLIFRAKKKAGVKIDKPKKKKQ